MEANWLIRAKVTEFRSNSLLEHGGRKGFLLFDFCDCVWIYHFEIITSCGTKTLILFKITKDMNETYRLVPPFAIIEIHSSVNSMMFCFVSCPLTQRHK